MTGRTEGEVSPSDLHALVDDQLAPERRHEVEAWLEANPQMAATVAGWRAQNRSIRALFGGDAGAIQAADRERLRALRARRAKPPARWLPALGAVLLFGLGIGAGALATRALQAPEPARGAQPLPEAARDVYLVYGTDQRRPVELGVDRRDELTRWLGERLGVDFAAPDLGVLGFRLVGGRLVPDGAAPAALLVYEGSGGARLTVLTVGDPDAAPDTGFRYAERDGIGTFYWRNDGLGHAVSAALPRDRLLALATAVYGQG